MSRSQLQPITEDDVERLCVCLRALADKSKVLGQVFGEQSREALVHMLAVMEADGKKEKVGIFCFVKIKNKNTNYVTGVLFVDGRASCVCACGQLDHFFATVIWVGGGWRKQV